MNTYFDYFKLLYQSVTKVGYCLQIKLTTNNIADIQFEFWMHWRVVLCFMKDPNAHFWLGKPYIWADLWFRKPYIWVDLWFRKPYIWVDLWLRKPYIWVDLWFRKTIHLSGSLIEDTIHLIGSLIEETIHLGGSLFEETIHMGGSLIEETILLNGSLIEENHTFEWIFYRSYWFCSTKSWITFYYMSSSAYPTSNSDKCTSELDTKIHASWKTTLCFLIARG